MVYLCFLTSSLSQWNREKKIMASHIRYARYASTAATVFLGGVLARHYGEIAYFRAHQIPLHNKFKEGRKPVYQCTSQSVAGGCCDPTKSWDIDDTTAPYTNNSVLTDAIRVLHRQQGSRLKSDIVTLERANPK